ncbi:MAG TPA: SGNH/GDSL hydrolase family protein [Chthoniobacteraceae bacterium]|nr:SGNH/GDSL hydrolase family protein [Chthoniobacteraceae bacterium]
MNIYCLRTLALAALAAAATVRAQVPQLINYQGRVVVDGVNFDGAGHLKFALVDAAGTTTYWSNDGTSVGGTEPVASVSLTVSKGLYSVLLGDTSLPNMAAVPASVFANSDVRLRMWFNDGAHGSQLLAPDQRIAAVGYAMIAGTVPDGSITATKIDPTTVQRRVTGTTPPGSFLTGINADGTVTSTPAIMSVTAGVNRVVFEGDSLTSGGQWANELAAAFPGAIKVNAAAAGDTASNMVTTFEAQITPYAPQSGQTSWFIVLAGVNDLYSTNSPEVYQSLKSIWAKARASGFRVCAVTLADSRFIASFDPVSRRSERLKLNDLIRQDPTLYDALLPFDRWLPNAQDPVYFESDQLHFTLLGAQSAGKMAAAWFTNGMVNATALSPEMVGPILWRDNLKRLAAEYATTFQPMDLDRFTQISSGVGTTFVPAYYGDYLITVSGQAGNSGGLTGRYPTNTSAGNIEWDTVTKRGVLVHTRHYFGTQSAGIVRVLVGDDLTKISGPLSRTGFGFECNDSVSVHQIRAVAHDGSQLTSGAWVPRFIGNTQWFAFCTNGVVTLWERYNTGTAWADWKLLQTISGGPTVEIGTYSQMVRINAEVGTAPPTSEEIFVDIIQVAVTLGLDRPYDLGAR